MLIFLTLITSLWATPYPFENELQPMKSHALNKVAVASQKLAEAERTLRVQVSWQSAGETYAIDKLVDEMSGTPARRARALKKDPYGSYQAELKIGDVVYHDAIGTGKEFRKLITGLTFRFPFPESVAEFTLWAENPLTGVREKVFTDVIDPTAAVKAKTPTVETRVLRAATAPGAITLAIYAEGYELSRKERFFERAKRVVSDLETAGIPGENRFHYVAVFAPSQEKLGRATDRGVRPVKRNSFLGLYFPHWNQFGRWYHVVYPTDEHQFRSALASVPYDYPLALIDDSSYWGVGNYMSHTAIPAESSSFTFLLLHEFGHFMGLNEEYEDTGRTELEHAPQINEPWSPNITFHPQRGELKWQHLVKSSTPLPTPDHIGGWSGKTVGAFVGGYAGSAPKGVSHKPVKSCTMSSGGEFCPVCTEALAKQLAKDAGE